MRTVTAITTLLLSAAAFSDETPGAREPAMEPDASPCVFGYCMGQAIDEEPDGTHVAGLSFITTTDHDLFAKVTIYWTPATGVCLVEAFYAVPSPDAHGDAHRSAFNHLTDLLRRKYGEPSDAHDHLRGGGVGEESRYWLQGLEQGERQLANYWNEKQSVLPAGLEAIKVEALPSFIVVVCDFANLAECLEEGRGRLPKQP